MKSKNIIVNRMSDWYQNTSISSDPFYVAMLILDKLSTRMKIGIKYNREHMSLMIMGQVNPEVIKTIDEAIVLLISRKLLLLQTNNNGKNLMITKEGIATYDKFKEEITNVD